MWPCKRRSKVRECVFVVSLPHCCAVVTLLHSKQRLGRFIIGPYQLSKTALVYSDCIGGKVRNQASCHEDMEVQLHTTISSAVDGGEQGRRLRVASGATAPGPALEGAPRFRPMSLSSYILR